jgi:hypothetical protein
MAYEGGRSEKEKQISVIRLVFSSVQQSKYVQCTPDNLTSKHYNCILLRSSSTLRFLLPVWIALVLMLRIFLHPKTNNSCLVSFQKMLPQQVPFFLFTRKLAKQKVFDLG